MKASELKQGQLFLLSGTLYRRVYQNGYIKTMKGPSGLDCIMAANDTMFTFVMVDNSVTPFEG